VVQGRNFCLIWARAVFWFLFNNARADTMKQLLLLTTIMLTLSGCAASLLYDPDRQPRDCRPAPDQKDGQRCLNSAGATDEVYRVAVTPVPGA
jgi:hypothetical protein